MKNDNQVNTTEKKLIYKSNLRISPQILGVFGTAFANFVHRRVIIVSNSNVCKSKPNQLSQVLHSSLTQIT